MIRDMRESFSNAIINNKNVILDNYLLKEGVYLKIDLGSNFNGVSDENILIINKKEEVKVNKLKLMRWFKERDYLSSLLNDDTNKAIDLPAKKIHSTNHFTIFIKKNICPYIGKPKDRLNHEELKNRIIGFYDRIEHSENKFGSIIPKNNLKGKDKYEYELEFLNSNFPNEMKYIKSDERKEKIEKCKRFFIDSFENIMNFMKEFNENNKFDNYIKFFIDAPIETYESENKIYLIPRIFNVNDYNLFDHNKILGLPANDITTNDKKPYLMLKTMKCKVPYRDTIENVRITKNFYDWLKKNSKDKNGEIKLEYDHKFNSGNSNDINESFYLVHTDTNNQVDDFDNIPISIQNIDFKFENLLRVETRDKKSKKFILDENKNVSNLVELQKLISDYFFYGNMKGYFKYYDPKVLSNKFTPFMKALFMKSRDAFFDYFHKGIDINIRNMINKISLYSIEEQIKNTVEGDRLYQIKKTYNLRISLLKYFNIKGGKEMASKIEILIDELKKKVNSEKTVYCEDSDEFYFLAGQLAYYIVSQSEASKKTFGLFEPFLIAKNSNQIKRKLEDVFEIYKHAINISNIKFKNAMSMVMAYDIDTKIQDHMKDLFLAGLLSNNMFYEK